MKDFPLYCCCLISNMCQNTVKYIKTFYHLPLLFAIGLAIMLSIDLNEHDYIIICNTITLYFINNMFNLYHINNMLLTFASVKILFLFLGVVGFFFTQLSLHKRVSSCWFLVFWGLYFRLLFELNGDVLWCFVYLYSNWNY